MIAVYDIGTTVLKGALMTEAGEFREFASRNLSMMASSPINHYEADPDEWKRAFREITLELLGKTAAVSHEAAGFREAGGSRNTLRAVIISGNGPTLVPISETGEFLKPVMSWMDRRGTEESARIQSVQNQYIDPTFYLPKALWIARNLPAVYEKTRFFLSCPESIVYWLTGNALTILPGDHFEQYFWNPELIAKLKLDANKFPDFVKPGTIAGKIGRLGAEASGLPENLPVIAAGPDFIVSLLGAGSVYPGRACDRAGTSEGINLCTKERVTDPRLMWYGHVVRPWYNISGIISTSGRALDWIKGVACGEEKNYQDFFSQLNPVAPGSDRLLFLPYLAGERAPLWDPAARGAFIGLGLNHGKAELVNAVLESVGYAMRDVIEVMAENGGEITELRITGGPSKSRLWNQIKADITGKPILVPESSESVLLGNLLLALSALGDTENLAETADSIVKIGDAFTPRSEYRAMYDDMFALYRESYRGLKEVFGRLAGMKDQGGI